MSDLALAILLIVGVFTFGLWVKRLASWRFCAICAAVSVTWVTLLLLMATGLYESALIVAVLMGQSVVGVYYLLERRLHERYHLFRLPYIVTGTTVVYLVVAYELPSWDVTILLVSLWVVFATLYVHRSNTRIRQYVQEIIACCRDW